MSESSTTKPPVAWLQQLHDAGHWERLITIAMDSLAIDPNDPETHRFIGWAYAKVGRLPQMFHHVSFLLNFDPDDSRHHHLAAVYFLDARQHQKAEPHIATLLRLEPHSATYHYLATILALRNNKLKLAQTHIHEARRLAPDWPAAAHLHIQIDGIHQKKASDAWNRIRRLEETLGLDPQHAGLMTSIGEIYLRELERPRDAEHFFREALMIDPTDKDRQALLLESLRARSLLYRTLSLPATAFRKFSKSMETNRARWFFVIIAIKAIVAFFIWVIVVGLFFAPAAKIYEWLVLTDISRSQSLPRWASPLTTVLRWPLWIRFAVCGAIVVGAWVGILHGVFRRSWSESGQIVAWVFSLHFTLVALVVGVGRLRARFGRWQDARRRRREARRALTVATA